MTVQSRSVLPPALVAELSQLGASLESGPSRRYLGPVLSGLSGLPVSAVVRASREIAVAAGLGWKLPPKSLSLWRRFRKPFSEVELMQINPDYAWLFVFHPDGHIREAALKAINTPPASPFFFAALVWRLNDWVSPVRQAAVDCAQRVLIHTDSGIAAHSALNLLDRRFSWGRWSDELHAFDAVFMRPEVIARLADLLREGTTGALATCLRYAMRYPAMDEHLLRLAREAIQPQVRAVAYRDLVSGKASWPVGFEWLWIDKVYGIRKRVPTFSSRQLPKTEPLEVLIAAGVHDRSTAVKIVVADALVGARNQVPNAQALIKLLASDRSPSVRLRADFLSRQQQDAQSS